MDSAVGQADGAQILVGLDPASEGLAVVPVSQARRDVAMIRALSNSRTLGEVRRNAEAWAKVRDWDVDDDAPDPDGLPAETPFNWVEWFGEDTFYEMVPELRRQVAAYCPRPVLEEFGRPDEEIGMIAYYPETWLSPSDQPAIEARLIELGYRIVHDQGLIDGYLEGWG